MKFLKKLFGRIQLIWARRFLQVNYDVQILVELLTSYPEAFELVTSPEYPMSLFIVPTRDPHDVIPVVCLEPTDVTLCTVDNDRLELNLLERSLVCAAVRSFNDSYHGDKE